MNTDSSRLSWILPALVAVLSLLFLASPLSYSALRIDEDIYLGLAQSMRSHGIFAVEHAYYYIVQPGESTLFWTPGLPMVLYFLTFFPFPLKTAAVGAQFIGWIASSYFVVRLSMRYAALPIRAYLALFAGLFPYFFLLCTIVTPEVWVYFLMLPALSLALDRETWSALRGILLGALLGGMALIRPEYALFSAALLFWVGLSLRDGSHRARAMLISSAAVFFLVLSPWIVRNHAVTGRWIFTTRQAQSLSIQNEIYYREIYGKGTEVEYYDSFLMKPSEIERYDLMRARALSFLAENPRIYAMMCAKRLVSILVPQQLKDMISAAMGASVFRAGNHPAWFLWSNTIFLAALALLFVRALRGWRESCARMFTRKSLAAGLMSPAGALALVLASQWAVYIFVSSVEYQRHIMSFPLLLLLSIQPREKSE